VRRTLANLDHADLLKRKAKIEYLLHFGETLSPSRLALLNPDQKRYLARNLDNFRVELSKIKELLCA
jgi:hypothetical protein